MILDKDLNFEFPPKQFKAPTSDIFSFQWPDKDSEGCLVVFMNNGKKPDQNFICRIDIKGNVRNQKFLQGELKHGIGHFFTDSAIGRQRLLLIFGKEGNIYELNLKDTSFRKIASIGMEAGYLATADLDEDGSREWLFGNSSTQSIWIMGNGMKRPQKVKIPGGFDLEDINSNIKTDSKHIQWLVLQDKKNQYFIRYRKNPYHLMGYFYPAGIYLLMYLFIWLIRHLQMRELERKSKIEMSLMNLRLENIRRQIEPHFTFNVINTAGSLIFNEKKEEAYDYLSRFSRLLRHVVSDTGSLLRPLEEELSFVTDYLELQKVRIQPPFEFSINIEEGIDIRTPVPSMVLQILAENCVKHGINDLQYPGIISVIIQKTNSGIMLIIEDNGRGVQVEKAGGTGKGLGIIREVIEILNSQKGKYSSTYTFSMKEKPEGGMRGEIIID
jgi:hypothetical protein